MRVVCFVTLYLPSAVPVKSCRSFLECLAFVQHCDGMVGLSALEKVKFTLRVQWVSGKWHLLSGNHDDAVQALTMVSAVLCRLASQFRCHTMPCVKTSNHNPVSGLVTRVHFG